MSTRIPRLKMEELREDLAQYLYETKVKRLGYFGEFFACTAHNPDVLLTFMEFTDALGKALPKNLAEIGALAVAKYMQNDYEKNQHERLCEKLGFSRAWIAAVNRLEPEQAAELDATEKAVQRYVLAALGKNGHGVEREFDDMVEATSPAQAMAVVMLVGRYVTHALAVNTLKLKPPVGSIFESRAA